LQKNDKNKSLATNKRYKTIWFKWLCNISTRRQSSISGDTDVIRNPQRFIPPNRYITGNNSQSYNKSLDFTGRVFWNQNRVKFIWPFPGINLIERLSFDPLNEGTRLIESVRYSRSLFGKITHVPADDIYATNANRKWAPVSISPQTSSVKDEQASTNSRYTWPMVH
jgi:hypothetical protein